MAWVRIDDGMFSHPKVLHAWATYPASLGLWPLAATWAARHRTDGHVSGEFVTGMMPAKRQRDRAIDALVESGLWVPNGTGWQIHDWRDYNGTRAELKAANERTHRERQR